MTGTTVYKYLPPSWGPVDTVVEILEKGQIGFTHPAALNDPFENRPSVSEYKAKLCERARELAGTDASQKYVEENFRRLQDVIYSRYVFLCLSQINSSELMWAHYCASHTGFVIGFDAQGPFFYPENEVSGVGLRAIDYSTKRIAFPADGMYSLSEQEQMKFVQSIFFTKSKEWRYEYESRLALNPQHATNKVQGANGFDVCLFKFQPNAVKEVILGCRISRSKRERGPKQRDFGRIENRRTARNAWNPVCNSPNDCWSWCGRNLTSRIAARAASSLAGKPVNNLDSLAAFWALKPNHWLALFLG